MRRQTVCVVIAFLLVAIGCTEKKTEQEKPEEVAKPALQEKSKDTPSKKGPTLEVGRLKADMEPIPVVTKVAIEEMMEAAFGKWIELSDDALYEKMKEFLAKRAVFRVKNDTKVRVMELHPMGWQIEVLEGKHTGKTGWVWIEWVDETRK